jgi:glycosyltransferase involved in cell wall biosynthesis
VVGGDIIYIKKLKKYIQGLGVEIEIVPMDELRYHTGADLLHLTQIPQLDAAEASLDWAEAKGMPVVINPFFEEYLAMWFRWAIRRQPKWRQLTKIAGMELAERIYTRWQRARRVYGKKWRRQRELLRRSHVIPNTRYELQFMQRWFNLPDLTGTIIPLGVDVELFGAWQTGEAEYLPPELRELCGRYILEVALINMRKNQVGLLQALAHTSEPIVFLGRPSRYEPECHEEVKRLARARGNVIFLEYVEENMLPAIYGNAQVHILPSWSERPGMVSLEAAACGCKVISSNRAPIHEYLEHRAWYVDPARPEEIAAAVQQAAVSQIPTDLREHALSFSWTRTAQKTVDSYAAILGGE